MQKGDPKNPLTDSDACGNFLDIAGMMIECEETCKATGLVSVLDQGKDGGEIVRLRHSK